MYLEVSWLFISHLRAFPLSNKRFVASPDLPCASGEDSSKKCGHLWTPHVLFDLDGYR